MKLFIAFISNRAFLALACKFGLSKILSNQSFAVLNWNSPVNLSCSYYKSNKSFILLLFLEVNKI